MKEIGLHENCDIWRNIYAEIRFIHDSYQQKPDHWKQQGITNVSFLFESIKSQTRILTLPTFEFTNIVNTFFNDV
jgi:hypothetical protein